MSVKVEQKDLGILLVSLGRYAIRRDNQYAAFTFKEEVEKYVPKFDGKYKEYIVNKLIDEIKSNMAFYEVEDESSLLQKTLVFLEEIKNELN